MPNPKSHSSKQSNMGEPDWQAPGFWVKKSDFLTRPHGLVETKKQRAPGGSGSEWGRRRQAAWGRHGQSHHQGLPPTENPSCICALLRPGGDAARSLLSADSMAAFPPRLSRSSSCHTSSCLRASVPAILGLEHSSPDTHTAHFLTPLRPALTDHLSTEDFPTKNTSFSCLPTT